MSDSLKNTEKMGLFIFIWCKLDKKNHQKQTIN